MDRFLLFFLLIVLFAGCTDVGRGNLKIEVDSLDIHLVADERYDQEVPPQLYFSFSVLELNRRLKPYLLTDKGSQSKIFIVDTVNNQIIPVRLQSTVIEVRSESPTYFSGNINIDEYAEYFELDSDYFYRLDFTSEKDFLREKCVNMLNSSVLIYTQVQRADLDGINGVKQNCDKSLVIFKPIYAPNDIGI